MSGVQSNSSKPTALRASGKSMKDTPRSVSRITLARNAGCPRSTGLAQGATRVGTPKPRSSANVAKAKVSAMPAAHLLIVLNDAGASTTASVGGELFLGSDGVLGSTRTEQPTSSNKRSRSNQVLAVGVSMMEGDHPQARHMRMNFGNWMTGGAAQPITSRFVLTHEN